MKLILASDLSFLLKCGYNLNGILKDQIRIGYITTASKGSRTEKQTNVENEKYIFVGDGEEVKLD